MAAQDLSTRIEPTVQPVENRRLRQIRLRREPEPSHSEPSPAQQGLSRISIVGWHGFRNAGDDAFLTMLVQWAVEQLGATDIKVWGRQSRLPVIKMKPGGCVQGVRPEHAMGRGEAFAREPTLLFGQDVAIFGAGSIFAVRRFAWLAVQLSALRVYGRLRRRQTLTAAVGVSIGPFRKRLAPLWCRLALRQFDIVMVRDQRSWELGLRYGIRNLIPSYDLALGLTGSKDRDEETRRRRSTVDPVVGFSLVDRDARLGNAAIDQEKNDRIFAALLTIARRRPDVRFRGYVFCRDEQAGDDATTDAMADRLRAAGCDVDVLAYGGDPAEMIDLIAESSVMICNRMHSFVFACVTQTPAVSISYAPKMDAFAASVGVDPELQFAHRELDAGRLAGAVERLLANPEPPCCPLQLAACQSELAAHLKQASRTLRCLAGKLNAN